ncbi:MULTISPECIES: FAD-dependent oxidoreductase [Catenuloplanes]|uniref:2-polyprenyl-6-methoxyphenol hydroxylase-like FAD-dependent oxidoreductase n=1 Tax=Catenuloplanes niger TaxID=587534 RepID=A0AAE3ZWD6_9ACTN|nr:FAD-dependent oxidoreductase [Catenuloplanes niger]MDR7327243.1 2-polyprenyl-6-methoxyphenol hydroxylase-like FAD-dependent oxidoreductase [Catenuloplanes niger]
MRRATICGAGIAGLTLAWWLTRDGWTVTLVERAPGPRGEGYLMDFFGSGYDVAERMGLLPTLTDRASPVDELVHLSPSGRRTGGLRYAAMTGVLGGRVLSLLRGDLESALRTVQKTPPRYGVSVAAAVPRGDRVDVELTDGTRHTADLLVGADGIHSRIRELVFGPEARFLRPLGFRTASYLFDDPDLAAWLGTRFAVIAAPGRQAGVYPTGRGGLAASLIHRTPPAARRIGSSGTGPPLAALFAGLGDTAARVLARCPAGPGLYDDCVAQVEMTSWTRGPVTLVGDAGYAVSLMAGQGASLAMGGAWLLAHHLAARPGDVPAALSAYQAEMLPFTRRKQLSGRRAAAWMVPSTRRRLRLRDRLMSIGDLPGGVALLRPLMATTAAGLPALTAVPRTGNIHGHE